MFKNLRNRLSPHTATMIGYIGMIAGLFLGVIIALAAPENGGKAAFIAMFIVAGAFVVFWFVFGRCYKCGRIPRPAELYCAGCGARLTNDADQKDDAPGKAAAAAEAQMGDRDLTETQISSEEIFDGVVLHLFKDEVRLPNGNTSGREYLKHLGAVCVVPLTEDRKVIVERQYRYAVRQAMIEIPAGKLDYEGEDRLEAAKRELREETGYTADKWTDMGEYLTAPAFSDEKISMYLAEGLHKGEQDLDEDEFLDYFEVPLNDLVKDVMLGKITDAKTQTGILKAAAILNARL